MSASSVAPRVFMAFSSAGWRKNGPNKVEFRAVGVLYESDRVPRLPHYADRRRVGEFLYASDAIGQDSAVVSSGTA
jgi:hypothetical protein